MDQNENQRPSVPENAAQKHSDGSAKTVVDKIQNDKGQDENPKQVDHNIQHLECKPQDNQAGQKGKDRVLNQIVHF